MLRGGHDVGVGIDSHPTPLSQKFPSPMTKKIIEYSWTKKNEYSTACEPCASSVGGVYFLTKKIIIEYSTACQPCASSVGDV